MLRVFVKRWIGSIGCILAGLALVIALGGGAALAQAPDGETDQGAAVIAAFDLDGGYHLKFVDEGDGIVGMVEISPSGTPSLLQNLTSVQAATPLEVFLAVVPTGQKAPAQILAAHREMASLLGRQDTAPRRLSLPAQSGITKGGKTNLIPPVSAQGKCDYNQAFAYDGQWAFDWYNQYKNMDFTAQRQYGFLEVPYTWYAGKTIQRWLGACQGYSSHAFPWVDVYFQYKNISGNWVTVNTTSLYDNEQVLYTSSSPSGRYYRVRLADNYATLYREVGAGVAGKETFGFGE